MKYIAKSFYIFGADIMIYHDNMICAMCSAEQLFNHGSVLDQRKTVGFLTLVLREAEKKKADIFRR